MDSIKALEKLRESSRLDDNKWTLVNGDIVVMYNAKPDDSRAVNWGEQWRKIADEIEAEIAERFMELPVDADGVPIRIGDTMERVCAEVSGTFIVGLIGADGHCMDDETSFFIASECRHVKPDTVESLLEEFHGKLWSDDEEQMALLEEYAERIRKAVE